MDALERFEDGSVGFASLRVPGWHDLGTVFQDEVTLAQMLKLAKLNEWAIHLEEITLPHRSHKTYFAVVRTNPANRRKKDVLGIVGERYEPLQNEDLLAWAEYLTSDGRWETAGTIKNGTQVFASLSMDRETVIDPAGVADRIKNYLLVTTSHDGTWATQAAVTPIRVVCQNTLNFALAKTKQTVKVRHTNKQDEKMILAAGVLGVGHNYIDAMEKAMTALYQTKVTNAKFDEIVEALYPRPDEEAKGAMTKWETKNDLLHGLWSGETQAGITGTAWGVVNTLTEQLDWYRQARGESADNTLAVARAGFDVAINAKRNKIMDAVVNLTGAKVLTKVGA